MVEYTSRRAGRNSPIIANLTGSTTCSVADITAHGNAPVLWPATDWGRP